MLVPYLLLAELGIFYAANAGDFYLTDALVKKHGPEIEANPRVRKMYQTNSFRASYGQLIGVTGIYAAFLLIVTSPNVEIEALLLRTPALYYLMLLLGMGLPAVAGYNLVRGGWVFYRIKTKGLAPESV